MDTKLIDLSTGELLEKFGAGSHKPGSGSAAALEGMLSAKLILTVIDLTLDKKRGKSYQSVLPKLRNISSDIKERIYPRLEELFQLDSKQFDLVIKQRNARTAETRFRRQRELELQVESSLKIATEIPIEIGMLGVELAEFANFIFKNAFKSARGDSGVAYSTAIAVIAGCISIIDLNLLSIKTDEEWIEKTMLARKQIKVEYEKLAALTNENLLVLENEVVTNLSFQKEIKGLLTSHLSNSILTNTDIENAARDVQNVLWKYKNKVWKDEPKAPHEILNPRIALEKLFSYKVIKRDTLDLYNPLGEFIEVAGIIDNNNKAVGLSTKFSEKIQNFTLAHELGHVLLHKQTGLHRDRPIDGSFGAVTRDLVELQADKFASYFLMPEKQIKQMFHQLFLTEIFSMNDDSIFALTGGSLSSFRLKCRSLRDLSRIIASAGSFYGNSFKSMEEVFNVSTEAMAIRLEELNLIEFESFVGASR